jgi:hypothetical protein
MLSAREKKLDTPVASISDEILKQTSISCHLSDGREIKHQLNLLRPKSGCGKVLRLFQLRI